MSVLEPLQILYLARQRLPAAAPQSIQILSTCWGLASAGARVSLRVDPPLSGVQPPPDQVLEHYGLTPNPRLDLAWLEARSRALRGLEYRRWLLAALWRGHREGRQTLVYSRRIDYAAWLLRWAARLRFPLRLVHEWHYVASANALERGQREESERLARAEATVLVAAVGHVVISDALGAYLRLHHRPRAPVCTIPNGGPEPILAGSVSTLSRPERSGSSLHEQNHPSPPENAGPPGSSLAEERRTVLYAGLFRRPEDLELVIALGRLLPDRVRLVVLGGDEEGVRRAQVLARAQARTSAPDLLRYPFVAGECELKKVNNDIEFIPACTPVQARAHMQRAHVGVATFADSLNMRSFASPLKLLEYHAAGLPLVSTDHPTVRELVRPGEDGLVVPHWSAEALAECVLLLLSDTVRADSLRTQGLARARERTWRVRGARLLALLRHL